MEYAYKIIDTHAHYDDEQFDEDRNKLLQDLRKDGVIGIVNCSSSYESIAKTIDIVNTYDYIYGALGIHPENADEFSEEVFQEIRTEIINNKKIIAVGEIGLDYYWDENPSREIQQNVLRRHMELAKELSLPVIIHDRDAHEDTLSIIKEFPDVVGVIHCFSGSVEFARECIKRGYYIGIGGVSTFKNSKKLKRVIEDIPVDRILVETDCPYMAPEPFRGKRNQSSYIKYVIDKIAEIKNIDVNELNKIINNNSKNIFKGLNIEI